MTIDDILDLADNATDYRYGLRGRAARRPPRFEELVDFIREHMGDRVEVTVEPWSAEPFRKEGRLRVVTGKRRTGFRLEVWPRGGVNATRDPLHSHVTCEAYRTNWDVVQIIAALHRQVATEAQPAAAPP